MFTPHGVRNSEFGIRNHRFHSAFRIPHSAFSLLVGVFLLASSVEAAIEITTDGRSLFFGLMQTGEEKTLAEAGAFHNQVTVTTTSGRSWYLKISLLRPLSSGADLMPPETLQWQLTRTDGTGTEVNRGQFRSFSLAPELVYISGSDEVDGRPVRLQFRYLLRVPQAQVSGVYSTSIRFTLTEVL